MCCEKQIKVIKVTPRATRQRGDDLWRSEWEGTDCEGARGKLAAAVLRILMWVVVTQCAHV